MSAYIIAQYRNSDEYAAYRRAASELNAKWGARILTKAGTSRLLEGSWEHDSMVVIEFESRQVAEAFYASDAYKAAKALRMDAPPILIVMVDGVDSRE